MLKRIILAGAAVLMLVALGAIPARASPATQASHLAPQAVGLQDKVTFRGETSIDGPALDSAKVDVPGVTETAMAWTGTDRLHKLNVVTSINGRSFGDKRTLGETSPYRPAVAVDGSADAVVIAWTGSDANHSLNVIYNVYGREGSPMKLTLRQENSISAPAVIWSGEANRIFLAWTGTDGNHSLNVMPITRTGTSLDPGTKTVLSQFRSNVGPHLARGKDGGIELSWTTRALQLRVAHTTANSNEFLPAGGAGLPETSAYTPPEIPEISDSNRNWIGWTGTDGAHRLNLQWTTTFPDFTDPATTKTTLDDTALGGPALTYSSWTDSSSKVQIKTLIAWTGTDGSHTLNVATITLP